MDFRTILVQFLSKLCFGADTEMKTFYYSSTSLFFKLPRELRDEIYEYVLTYPNGVFATIYTPKTPRLQLYALNDLSIAAFSANEKSISLFEANKLKYVCHQMLRETRQLGLKYNEVFFLRHGYKQAGWAITQCSIFLPLVAPEFRHWLRKVTIVEKPSKNGKWGDYGRMVKTPQSPPVALQEVLRFAAKNPEVQISYCMFGDTVVLNPNEWMEIKLHDGAVWRGQVLGLAWYIMSML